MTASQPRAHHFVPEFYLAGFTGSGQRDGRLAVLGLGELAGREWWASPNSLGHERDFYRDDSDMEDPTWFERDLLGGLEGESAGVLKDIAATCVLPDRGTRAWQVLMNFVAVMYARGPGLRDLMSRPILDIAQMIMQSMVADRGAFDRMVAEMRVGGQLAAGEEPSYEEMRAAVQQGGIGLSLARPYLLRTILRVVEIVLPQLDRRSWTLLINQGAEQAFLVTDRPVAITHTVPQPQTFYNIPTFGRGGTDVTMPVSKDLALMGRLENQDRSAIDVDAQMIATVNSKTLWQAERFACGPSKERFAFVRADGTIGTYDDLRLKLGRRVGDSAG